MSTPSSYAAAEVRRVMKANSVSISELSRISGLALETTRRRVKGQGPWSFDDAVLIAEALGLDIADIRPGPT